MATRRATAENPRHRRRWLLAPLSLALFAGPAGGAAFLPGTVADPPTGERDPGSAQGREPLRGDGIRWTLAPWQYGGLMALDLRSLRPDNGRSSNQGLVIADLDMATHVWQPWFVQLRVGLGLIASRASGDAQTAGGDNGTVTGRAALLVFPASRFPFELRADVGDSRSNGPSLGGDYRSRRVSLTQGYRPETGNDSLQLQVERSQLEDARSRDTLTTVNASALRHAGAHQFDLALGHSDNRRSDSDERTRLSSASARHGYQPSGAFNLETVASWNELRLRASTLDVGSDVRQISSFASWRLGGTGFAPGGSAPLLAATARWVDARTLGSDIGSRVQAYNATLGLSQELSPAWRASVSGRASHLQSTQAPGGDGAGLQAAVNWSPPASPWGAWRYASSAGGNLGLERESGQGSRRLLGLQASQGLSRDVALGEGQSLALNFTQSGAVLQESRATSMARALAHGASVSWQGFARSGGQSFGGVSLSDSRTFGSSRGRFQLANVQLSQRTQLARHASWSANLTLQASRNESSEFDVFTGTRREAGQGWQRFYNGTLAYENQRAFGVPRLRATVLLGLNSQPLERRALGDIDAPRERISESLEARLDYDIGRLETRLSARAAKVDGRVVSAVQARAQRRF